MKFLYPVLYFFKNILWNFPFPLPDPRLDVFREQISEFHKLDAPEEDKLRQKDQDLVNLIARIERLVNAIYAKGDITRIERVLFILILGIFMQVESILWELKHLPGDQPKSDPEPKNSPGPQPTPGPDRV